MRIRPSLHPLLFEDTVRRALSEDLGRGGDLTTDAIVDPEIWAEGRIIARAEGRVAGLEVAATVFRLIDPRLRVTIEAEDAMDAEVGQVLLRVEGSARSILSAERVALNFLGLMCGVATKTRAFVEATAGSKARVVDTRKTTPGLRALQKYAVRCGGGSNHRLGLDDAVLIKDNHLIAAGGVEIAVRRARAAVGHTAPVELEVDTLDQLREGLAAGVDAVLLDNMPPEVLREAVVIVNGRAITEASGGVTLESVAAVAGAGVDIISVGGLTHSASALDVALDLHLEGR